MRRVRLLRDLAVHGTVAATAHAAHLSGPAVSQQLAALEKETGMSLLVKQGRTLRLTAAGMLLVEHAEVILGNMAAAEADLAALRGGSGGIVKVAVFPSAARTLMPTVWSRLAREAVPAVKMRVLEYEPDHATRALRLGEVDIAVVHAYSVLPRDVPPGCDRNHLFDEPVRLVLHPDRAREHGLHPQGSANLADFADDDWLMPGPETSCHEMTQRACGVAGFVPHAVALATDFAVLASLVAVDAGVALIPAMALPDDAVSLEVHPLSAPLIRSVYALTPAGARRQPHIVGILGILRTLGQARTPHSGE